MPKWLVFSGIILAHLDAEEERALGRLDKTFDEEELGRLGRDFLAAEEGIMAKARSDRDLPSIMPRTDRRSTRRPTSSPLYFLTSC